MMPLCRLALPCNLAALLALGLPGELFGQSYIVRPGAAKQKATQEKADDNKTIVVFELLTGKDGVNYRAILWRPIFQELDVSFRIRRGTLNDKIETTEEQLGPLRKVTVTGKLDRQGRLIFQDRVFTRDETERLKEWVDGLKTYGALGSPKGRKLWGLSKAQFGAVYTALSGKVESPTQGLPLESIAAGLRLPGDYSLRFSTGAERRLASEFPGSRTIDKELKGRARGTALALALADYGLGFRPLRTPRGEIELVVEPLNTTGELWPVGWEFKDSRLKTAPGLFKLKPVELADVKLIDVLNAVEKQSGVPIFLDRHRIEAAGVDLEKVRVSHPRRQTSFSLLLRAVTNPHKLTRELRIDETGQPFVWITTLTGRGRGLSAEG